MALDIIHNVNKAVYQLVNAPKDIQAATQLSDTLLSYDQADAAHQEIYQSYKKGFEFFYPAAKRWWNGCIAAEMQGDVSRDDAIQRAYEKRVAGPASAPEIVWFVRYFWFRCDDLNKTLPTDRRVPPEELLLNWLVADGEQDNVILITCMPYWPIGIDEDGEWC